MTHSGDSHSYEEAKHKLQDFMRSEALRCGGRRVVLNRGQMLFHANDKSDGIYILDKGCIRVYIKNQMQDEIELALLKSGSVIGEMSLYGESTRSASCVGYEDDTVLVFIERERATELIDSDVSARRALTLILNERSRSMVRFIHEFSHLTSLVANGSYDSVQMLLSSSSLVDPTLKSAREAFKKMLDRVKERESSLQTTIATLSLEIDRKKATEEVDAIINDSQFQRLQNSSADLRARLRGNG